MPRKRSSPAPPEPAKLTVEDMKMGIQRLKKRIEELKQFEVSTVQRFDDPRIDALTNKIDQTLEEIFGSGSAEYKRYRVWDLDTSPRSVGGPPPIEMVREGLTGGIAQTVANLQTIVEMFTENLDARGESPGARARSALAEHEIQPDIERAAGQLFESSRYANAVEDACKALDLLVRLRSGVEELTGTELMQKVFSVKKPILRFNDLVSETDRSEQQGMMHLYIGAMQALRNPRAHSLVDDDPDRALEIILFLSYLAYSLDRAQKT